MKQYIGTKMIQAVKGLRVKYVGKEYFLADGTEPSQEAQEALENSADIRAMYMVQYPDGYVSFSPVDVFEEAYRPTEAMNFGLAIEAAKKGAKITRRGWNGKGMWVVYRTGYPDGIPCNKNTADAVGIPEGSLFKVRPYLQMKCVDGSFQMWLASQSDILADDWEIVGQAVERCE